MYHPPVLPDSGRAFFCHAPARREKIGPFLLPLVRWPAVDADKNKVDSGRKYRTPQGFSAVKNGVKQSVQPPVAKPRSRKPAWLKAELPTGKAFAELRRNVREHALSTVCEESFCPNIG